jgi:hypothetical protein
MIFTILEFKEIIRRDKGGKIKGDYRGDLKLKAIRDFTFIYHYADPRSAFSGYDEDERIKIACETAELDVVEVEADETLWLAVDKYKQILEDYSPMMSTLRAVRKMNTQLKKYFEGIDFDERDKKGSLVYNIANVMESVNKLPGLQKTISQVEKDVIDSLKDASGGIRGANEKTENDDRKIGRKFSEARHNPLKTEEKEEQDIFEM